MNQMYQVETYLPTRDAKPNYKNDDGKLFYAITYGAKSKKYCIHSYEETKSDCRNESNWILNPKKQDTSYLSAIEHLFLGINILNFYKNMPVTYYQYRDNYLEDTLLALEYAEKQDINIAKYYLAMTHKESGKKNENQDEIKKLLRDFTTNQDSPITKSQFNNISDKLSFNPGEPKLYDAIIKDAKKRLQDIYESTYVNLSDTELLKQAKASNDLAQQGRMFYTLGERSRNTDGNKYQVEFHLLAACLGNESANKFLKESSRELPDLDDHISSLADALKSETKIDNKLKLTKAYISIYNCYKYLHSKKDITFSKENVNAEGNQKIRQLCFMEDLIKLMRWNDVTNSYEDLKKYIVQTGEDKSLYATGYGFFIITSILGTTQEFQDLRLELVTTASINTIDKLTTAAGIFMKCLKNQADANSDSLAGKLIIAAANKSDISSMLNNSNADMTKSAFEENNL